MLTHKVKVNAVDNLSDARYCAGMFVDFIGFSLKNEQNEWIEVAKITEMINWLSGVTFIGEVGEQDWPTNAHEYPFHIWETSNYVLFEERIDQGFQIALCLDASDLQFMDKLMVARQKATYVRIKNASLEFVNSFTNWDEKIFIHLTTELVAARIWEINEAIQLAVDSGREVRPGQSDFGSLMDVLEALDM